MIRKRILMGLAALTLTACLDRSYDNPFLTGSGSDVSEDWKRDRDGNGIADSVEAYAPGCQDLPAECLRRAKLGSVIAGNPVTKIGKDTTPNVPKDTLVVHTPQDTVRDTVIVSIPVTAIAAANMVLNLGAADRLPAVTFTPYNCTNKTYTLASDWPGIVSVTVTGLHAVSGGTATITITALDGGKHGTFKVMVRKHGGD